MLGHGVHLRRSQGIVLKDLIGVVFAMHLGRFGELSCAHGGLVVGKAASCLAKKIKRMELFCICARCFLCSAHRDVPAIRHIGQNM